MNRRIVVMGFLVLSGCVFACSDSKPKLRRLMRGIVVPAMIRG